MLQQFGEHIRGWLAWIIIACIAIALCAWGLSSYLESGVGKGKVVAEVNGEKIYQAAVDAQFQTAYRQQFKGKTLTSVQQKALREQVLQRMIVRMVLLQALHKAGFSIGLPELQAMIQSDPQLQEKGRFSQARFQLLLNNLQKTPTQFFADMGTRLLVNQFRVGLVGTALALPDEVNQLYQKIHEERDFRYVIIPASHYRVGLTITDKAAKQYYDTHKAQFLKPASVQLEYLLLSPYAIAKQVTVTPAQVKAYYAENQTEFTIPQSWVVAQLTTKDTKAMQAVLSKLHSGTPFMTLMKTQHASWTTKQVTWSSVDLPPQLVDLLKRLKLKTASEPVPTQSGVSLFYVLKTTPAKVKPFKMVSADIEKRLRQSQAQAIFMKKASQLSDLTFRHSTSLAPAAKALGLTVQTSPLLTQQGKSSGLFSNADVMAAAFSPDVLDEGYNSKPISLQDSSAMVLRVKSHTPQKQVPFSEVVLSIKKTLQDEMASRHAGLFAYQLQSDLAKHQNIDAKLHTLGLSWVNKKSVMSNEKSMSPLILKKAFEVPNHQVGTVELPTGYALVQVTHVTAGDLKKMSAKTREALELNIANEWGQAFLQLYLSGEMDKAEVKKF